MTVTQDMITSILRNRGAIPVDSIDVAEGDRLLFATADNGYGGSGAYFWRTGVVRKFTAAMIYVTCDPNRMGPQAALYRRDWHARSVHRLPAA